MRHRSNRRINLGHSSGLAKLNEAGSAIVFDAILFFGKRLLSTRGEHASHCMLKIKTESLFCNLSITLSDYTSQNWLAINIAA